MHDTTRARLHQQGYIGLDDASLDAAGPWLRIAPAVCAAITLLGTATGSWAMLWALAPAGTIAAITRRHPVDRLLNRFVMPRLGLAPLPAFRAPRRFSAGTASAFLAAAGLALFVGATRTGTLLGLFLGGALALGATTDICTGCVWYHRLRDIRERLQRRATQRAVLSVTRPARNAAVTTAPRLRATTAGERRRSA